MSFEDFFQHMKYGLPCMQAKLNGADFSERELKGLTVVEGSFVEAKFARAKFKSMIFVKCDFSASSFEGATFEKCQFVECDLQHARFDATAVKMSVFTDCNGEHISVFANIELLLPEIRAAYGPQFAASLEKLIDATPDGRKRTATLRERIKGIRETLAKQQAQKA